MQNTYRVSAPISRKIEIASFLATIMVLYIHASFAVLQRPVSYYFVESLIGDGICRIAVPFFFFKSGYFFFLHVRGFKAIPHKIVTRIRSLAVPYFLWATLGLLFLFIVSFIPTLQGFIVRDLPWHSVHSLGKYFVFSPINYQLWFLKDLLILAVLSPVVYASVRYLSWIPALLLGAQYLVFPSTFGIFYAAFPLFFFVLGTTLAMKKPQLIEYSPKETIFYLLLALFTIFSLYNATSKPLTIPFYNWLNQFLPILGIAVFWFTLLRIKDWDTVIPVQFTTLSFFIYLAHEPMQTFIKKSFILVMPQSTVVMLCSYLLLPMISLAICIVAGLSLKKYLPQVYSVLVAGR